MFHMYYITKYNINNLLLFKIIVISIILFVSLYHWFILLLTCSVCVYMFNILYTIKI